MMELAIVLVLTLHVNTNEPMNGEESGQSWKILTVGPSASPTDKGPPSLIDLTITDQLTEEIGEGGFDIRFQRKGSFFSPSISPCASRIAQVTLDWAMKHKLLTVKNNIRDDGVLIHLGFGTLKGFLEVIYRFTFSPRWAQVTVYYINEQMRRIDPNVIDAPDLELSKLTEGLMEALHCRQ